MKSRGVCSLRLGAEDAVFELALVVVDSLLHASHEPGEEELTNFSLVFAPLWFDIQDDTVAKTTPAVG